jgi:hypothetical protein
VAFSPFPNNLGFPDASALLEQTILVWAVYNGRQDVAQQLLDAVGGGTILSWNFQPTSWPPSWALLRQGNHLYFVFAGTVNNGQLLGDITGAFAAPYPGFGNQAHSFFLGTTRNLAPAITAALPPDYATCDVSFCGHSFGGSLAFILATEWHINVPGPRVELLSLGAPKPFTTNYGGALPNVCLAVGTTNDAVCFLPPGTAIAVALGPLSTWALGVPTNWTHYGDCFLLDSGGVPGRIGQGFWNATPSVDVVTGTTRAHPSGNYLLLAYANWNANGNAQPNPGIGRIAANILGITPVAQNAANVNVDAFVNPAQQNAQIFMDQQGGVLNPGNLADVENFQGDFLRSIPGNAILPGATARSSDMTVKVTYFYHDGGKAGISESWYLPGPVNEAGAVLLTQNYLKKRMPISGQQTVFDYARWSNIPANRVPITVIPSDLSNTTPRHGSFATHGIENSDIGNTALEVQKTSPTRFGRMFLRGIPDVVVEAGGEYTPVDTFPAKFKAFATQLILDNYSFGGVDPTLTKSSEVTAMAQNTNGTIQFTLFNAIFAAGPPPAGDEGRHLQARISGAQMNRQLNGPLVIVVDGVANCHSVHPIALNALAPGQKVILTVTRQVFYPINGLKVIKAGERKAGRPTKVSVGRVKNRPRG